MAANNITIGFNATGDEKLIKAFKDLATAQSKFNSATKKSTSSAKTQEEQHKKLNAGMMRLRANFKAHGKSLMDAGVNAKLYSSALKGNLVAIEKVKIAVKRYTEEQNKANVATRILGGSVAVLRSKMLVAAFAFSIVRKPFLDLMQAYSDSIEVSGKFNVVFGEVEGAARDFSRALAGEFGRSQTAIMDFMSTLQDTFVPLGFARGSAANLSSSLTKLALDVASFNNKMDADVVRDFQSAIVGNHETVKKYGIILNEAKVAQAAMDMGLINSSGELSEYAKVLARVELITQGTKDAQGDVSRTFDTLANSVKATQASFQEFKEEFGEILEPVAMALLEVAELAMNLARLIKIPLSMISAAFGAIGQILNSVNIVIDGFFDLFKEGTPSLTEAEIELAKYNEQLRIQEELSSSVGNAMTSQEISLQGLKDMYSQTREFQEEMLDSQIALIENMGGFTDDNKELSAVYDMLIQRRDKLTQSQKSATTTEKKLAEQVVKSSFAMGKAYDNTGMAALKGAEKVITAEVQTMTVNLMRKFIGENPSFIGLALAGMASSIVGSLVGQGMRSATRVVQKFEDGGLVGGRRHSQGGTMIEAEQGEFVMSRNAVDAIGVENLNRMNRGGGGAVNITFTGNVMSQDFIENEAIPQIKEAIRRGADIGVA